MQFYLEIVVIAYVIIRNWMTCFQKEEYDLEDNRTTAFLPAWSFFQSGIWWNASFLLLLEYIC